MRYAEVECRDCGLHFKVILEDDHYLSIHCIYCGSQDVSYHKINGKGIC